MIFISEIEVIRLDGTREIHDGPLIVANSFADAETKAKKMNINLEVIGKYISPAEFLDV